MISGNHWSLREKCGLVKNELSLAERKIVEIDYQKQISIDNISGWEIKDEEGNILYRISTLGLAQNNYNDRVMVRGKQTENHTIGQYIQMKYEAISSPLINYITEEEIKMYLGLLKNNRIRECIEYLRSIENKLNTNSRITTSSKKYRKKYHQKERKKYERKIIRN